MKQRISLVITDFDNTLFDWLEFWHRSFRAMLDALVHETGIQEDVLIPELKEIHEKYGTSEYAFSIEQLPSLKAKYRNENLVEKFRGPIKAYGEAREQSLALYPQVKETLEALKDKGTLLVGYTESMAFYSNSRVRFFELDRVLDYLYSPPDHQLPEGYTRETIRSRPREEYELRRTIERPKPDEEKKPNPSLLLDIVRELGGIIEETVYVGDDLVKDVDMAQRANITDVHAKYGKAHHREEYELLKRVTHWTKAEVEKQRKVTEKDIRPTHVLENHFGELLDKFDFRPFVDRSECRLALSVDVWKKTVEVQQHFNDLELRIRNFAITILAGVLGLAAYGLKENLSATVFGHPISVAGVILFAGLLPWAAFYFMDCHWYHRLLNGAVRHGKFIEDRLRPVLPEVCLTDSIAEESPTKIWRFLPKNFPWILHWLWKNREMHSTHKMNLFYGLGAILLLALSLLSNFYLR